jgi:hypothetical protein
MRPDMLARRRSLLAAPRPPQIWALIEEAVLQRPPGGIHGTLAGQLTRLIEAAAAPGITVQVVPIGAPGPLTAGGTFAILRLPGRDLRDVVVLEQLTTIATVVRLREVDRYWEAFNKIALEARDPETSLQVLHDIAQSLPGSR